MSELAYSERRISRRRGIVPIDAKELWRYRELFLFLAWRDFLVRYKQTVVGVSWALIQPILMATVLTVVFGSFAELPSGGVPYSVMTLAAVLPWQYFSNALTQSSNSVVTAANLVSKVYFPRMLLPASACLVALVEFGLSMFVLIGLLLWYRIPLRSEFLLIPLFLGLAVMTAIGFGLWLAALNVQYRDIRHVVPFVLRIALYISPVGFMSSIVPEQWGLLYSLNPMVGVIDGFRWAILGPEFEPHWLGFWISFAVSGTVLVVGAYYFRFAERTFPDVI